MKRVKTSFWITALIITLWFGIGPLFAYDDPTSVKVIMHLGYPVYFPLMLTCFKVLGVIAIVIPKIPNRIKEWAYAGFAIDLICASIGFIVIDGFIAELLLPITAFTIVIINYFCFSKIQYSNA
ncbi:MAG: DoxX family protein [Saprospiraceae bacterium]|nr:DoxX family protein [Saprospiraceae bacterium]